MCLSPDWFGGRQKRDKERDERNERDLNKEIHAELVELYTSNGNDLPEDYDADEDMVAVLIKRSLDRCSGTAYPVGDEEAEWLYKNWSEEEIEKRLGKYYLLIVKKVILKNKAAEKEAAEKEARKKNLPDEELVAAFIKDSLDKCFSSLYPDPVGVQEAKWLSKNWSEKDIESQLGQEYLLIVKKVMNSGDCMQELVN